MYWSMHSSSLSSRALLQPLRPLTRPFPSIPNGSAATRRAALLTAAAESEGDGWIARNQDALRAAPLAAGGLGVAGVVLNRAFSGAVGLDASSAGSRTDVIIIALSAVLLLTGLQWLALRPVEKEAVELDGEVVSYAHSSLPGAAKRELTWAFESLTASTRCRALIVLYREVCIFHEGAARAGAEPAASKPGPICRAALEKGRGNYLANLALYPGRFEFLEYLPPNTQGVLVKPLGADGVLIAAADTQRAFGNVDQAWLALIADKLESTLEGFVPSGTGFKAAAAAAAGTKAK